MDAKCTDDTFLFVTLVYFRLHESSLQSLLTMSPDPLMSCLGAVLWCLLSWTLAANWRLFILTDWLLKVRVKVTLRLTASQSVKLGFEPDIYYSLCSYGLVFVGRLLWREDGSVFCTCCWPLPAQFFLGPSPLVLATIFYSLRSETSLFVASYDSQGHGAGIWPRLHTGWLTSRNWMLLKSNPSVPNRKHLVAKFMFPVLTSPWIQ
jgi:hypothetical protein